MMIFTIKTMDEMIPSLATPGDTLPTNQDELSSLRSLPRHPCTSKPMIFVIVYAIDIGNVDAGDG